jgi:sporulation protein YlmC with PRC-barrel domain
MYTILNQKGEAVAYIQNMMIMDLNQEQVHGILIGDCFFGKKNHIIGKIFNKTVYLANGEVVGTVVLNTAYKNIALKKANMQAAWDILSNIKDHTSPWIIESKKWAAKPLLFHLL